MKVVVELTDEAALALHALLHDDGGLREGVAAQLLTRHTPHEIQAWTEAVAGLGAVARGLTLALEPTGRLQSAAREDAIRRMALEHVRAIARERKTQRGDD